MASDFATGQSRNTMTDPVPEQAEEFNMEEERRVMTRELENTREIDSIVSTISAYEVSSVVTFGAGAAAEISAVSDQVLRSINASQINESGRLLNRLSSVMDRFDIREIADSGSGGFWKRLRRNSETQLDKILAKYHAMGEEVDGVYMELKRYESDIQKTNDGLEKLYLANVGYYKQLVKYILAGEQAIRELGDHIAVLQAENREKKDAVLALDIRTVEQVQTVLEQRVMDLKLAEQVAMQSLPMLKTIQYSNAGLIRKINSAFIVTLPVFKQMLAQAVMLKRQRIQAEALNALEQRAGDMLARNAQHATGPAQLAERSANTGSTGMETLEQTWQTIVCGIGETRQIQENARQKQEEGSQRLNRLKKDFENRSAASAL